MDIFDMMPASRLGAPRDHTSSDDEQPLTTTEIMALRVKMAAEAATQKLEPEPEPEYADVEEATRARIGALPGVPIYVGKESFDMVNQRPVTEADILATVLVFKERLPSEVPEPPRQDADGTEELPAADEQHTPRAPLALKAWLFQRGLSVGLERLARILEPRRSASPRSTAVALLLRKVRSTLQRVQMVPTTTLTQVLSDDASALDVLLDEVADIVAEMESHARESSQFAADHLSGIEWVLGQLGVLLGSRTGASLAPFRPCSPPVSAARPPENEAGVASRSFAPQPVAWEHLEACQQTSTADLTSLTDVGGQLFDAVESNDLVHLGYLLDLGVPASVRGNDGDTPLMAAAARDHVRCLDLLLQFGADPSDADSAGDTALHYASSFASMECVRKLARRCDSAKYVGSRNHAGQTSRALAESLSLWSVVALLDEVFEDTTGISPPLPAGTGPDLRRPTATGAGTIRGAGLHGFQGLPPARWDHQQVVSWFEHTFSWSKPMRYVEQLRLRPFVDGQMLTVDLSGVLDALGVDNVALRRQVSECLAHKDTTGWD
jgi:hypothetical protein